MQDAVRVFKNYKARAIDLRIWGKKKAEWESER